MLREPAAIIDYPSKSILFDDSIEPDPRALEVSPLREWVQDYMAINEQILGESDELMPEDEAMIARGSDGLIVSFYGYLRQPADQVYTALDQQLAQEDMFPLLRERPGDPDAPHVIRIVAGRPAPATDWPSWPNIALFIATIFSVLFTGTTIAIGEISLSDPARAEMMGASLGSIASNMWRGWPYALSLLLVLVPHEMGHYLMMRRYGMQASLPYFIPAFLISPFGTFGAAIVLRDSVKNRRHLLDIGAAGPLAGFVVAVPLVIIGLMTSQVIPITPGGAVEGNSLLYMAAKLLVFGEVLPNGEVDVMVNQVAWAGWTGLFITALNLIPMGQLDGGHIMYALLGERARQLFWPAIIGLVGLSFITQQGTWLFFLLILFFVGRFYAVPMDAITPLNPARRVLAITALVVFVLTFTPVPIYTQTGAASLPDTVPMAFQMGVMGVTALVMIPRWWRSSRLKRG